MLKIATMSILALEKWATTWSFYGRLQPKKDAVQSATIFCRTFYLHAESPVASMKYQRTRGVQETRD